MNRNAIITSTMLTIVVILGLVMLRQQPARTPVRPTRPESGSQAPKPRRNAPRDPVIVRGEEQRRPLGLTASTPVTTEPARSSEPALSGYTIDRFSGITSFPAGYVAQDVVLSSGGLTLATGPGDSPRLGMVESPALPLREPTQALAPPARKELPAGCSVQVEIALSRDGRRWTQWYLLERHGLAATEMAGGSAAQAADPAASVPGVPPDAKGPFIKYRLTMTAQGAAAPVLHDLRIWRRVTGAEGDALNRDLVELTRVAAATSGTTQGNPEE